MDGSGAGEGEGGAVFVEVLRCEFAAHEVDHCDAWRTEEAGDDDEGCDASGVTGGGARGGVEICEGGAADDGAVRVGDEEDVVAGVELAEDGRADCCHIVFHLCGSTIDVLIAVAWQVDADDCVASGCEVFADVVEVGWDMLRAC